ncbi:MAG: 50S ribosomal protein L9 [Clostridia bacterium]|nr:50S ribosomal protein L9 [Clostridia bacterium]
MKVVLNADVKDLGKKGELVNVSDGYAKNYLIPRKLAKLADAGAMNELKNKAAAEQYRLKKERETAEQNAKLLEGKTIAVKAKAGANGRLFGSVTSKEIAERIKEEFGVEIDRKKIVSEDIRQYGTYGFTVKIYSGITVQMFVFVGE